MSSTASSRKLRPEKISHTELCPTLVLGLPRALWTPHSFSCAPRDDIMQDMKGVVQGGQKVGLDHLLMSQWQQQREDDTAKT